MLRVLIVHNAYQHRGGEDSVVDEELSLLTSFGHSAKLITRSNDEIRVLSTTEVAFSTIWSRTSRRWLRDAVSNYRPDVIHVHNTFPLISPSIYWAASRLRVPIVQTLHNFRLLCAQAMFLRDGKICEDCIGTFPWRGVVRRCYRESLSQSAALVSMLGVHRTIGTFQDKVSRYIALNEFCREKFVEGGLPRERIAVKPNFIDRPQVRREGVSKTVLYVGRLSEEKGIVTLAGAAAKLPEVTFEIIGDGPESFRFSGLANVRMRGSLPMEDVLKAMSSAYCLVMPSIWYENFPRTLVESFAVGLPVIASRIGALAELIADRETGLLFKPGDAVDLSENIRWAFDNERAMKSISGSAVDVYNKLYTPEKNYEQLIDIYNAAINDVE